MKSALQYTGTFYAIQLDPTLRPNRVKVGFSKNVPKRLKAYKTANPEAEILQCWPCSAQSIEVDTICHLSLSACCKRIGGSEVFEFEDREVFFKEVTETLQGIEEFRIGFVKGLSE